MTGTAVVSKVSEPGMKDSGIDWIGKIPEDWKIVPLKSVSAITMGQSPPSEDVTDVGIIPFLQGNAEFGKTYPIPVHFCDSSPKLCKKNDILLSVRAPVGKINLADQVYGIGRGLCAITPFINLRFVYNALFNYSTSLLYYSNGSTFDAVTMGDLRNYRIAIPDDNSQRAIAHYLDKKCNAIDSLISAQKNLVTKLKEYRQSLITEAVTKGLDPDAPMKDSGIEWIGKIPADWEIKKLKFVAHSRSEKLSDKSDPELAITYVEISDVSSSEGITHTSELLFGNAPSRARRITKKGDIIISTVRTYLKAITYIEVDGLIVSTGFSVIVADKIYAPFLKYAILSDSFIQSIIANSYGVSYPAITEEKIMQLEIVVPSEKEQYQIATQLDNTCKTINSLISKTEQHISKLSEIKQSLIYEYVTGKKQVPAEALE